MTAFLVGLMAGAGGASLALIGVINTTWLVCQ